MGNMKHLYEELSSMPYNDLLKLAKEKGVSAKGKKAEIIERLCNGNEKKSSKTGIVNVAALNVRKEPSMRSIVLGVVHKGDTLDILGEENDFYSIPSGYVKKEFIDVK